MSIRANPRVAASATTTSQAPINFKDEFVHSTAALAASHDETVSHILSRLDQLHTKISTQPETAATPTPRSSAPLASRDQSVHARLASLEAIHEDALHRLSSKLDQVERQLTVNKESESLMTQIASRLQQVEPRLQSQANLADRVASLESRLQTHTNRVSSLESQAQPDANQERILARINSKLDILEEQQRSSKRLMQEKESFSDRKVESFRKEPERKSMEAHMEADMDKQERARYLQNRIEKLKELRGKYEDA